MRLSNIVVWYGVVGVVMWGGGVIDLSGAGILNLVIDVNASGQPVPAGVNDMLANVVDRLESNASSNVLGFGAALLAVAKLFTALATVASWPLVAAIQVGMPAQWAALFGGVPTLAFFMGFLKIIRSSV
jgi:hypothetical protein